MYNEKLEKSLGTKFMLGTRVCLSGAMRYWFTDFRHIFQSFHNNIQLEAIKIVI